MHFQQALIILVGEDALSLFRFRWHQVAALNVVVPDNYHDLQQPVVEKASDLQDLL